MLRKGGVALRDHSCVLPGLGKERICPVSGDVLSLSAFISHLGQVERKMQQLRIILG